MGFCWKRKDLSSAGSSQDRQLCRPECSLSPDAHYRVRTFAHRNFHRISLSSGYHCPPNADTPWELPRSARCPQAQTHWPNMASRRLSAVLAMTVDLSQRFGVDGVTDLTTVATSSELAHFALLPLRLVVQNGAAIHLSIVGRLQLRGVTWVCWPAQNLPGTTSFAVYHSVSTVTTQILLKDISVESKKQWPFKS